MDDALVKKPITERAILEAADECGAVVSEAAQLMILLDLLEKKTLAYMKPTEEAIHTGNALLVAIRLILRELHWSAGNVVEILFPDCKEPRNRLEI